MSRINASETSEVSSFLKESLESIRSSRSVKIKLTDFPSTVFFSSICDSLENIIRKHSPSLVLEQISVADNGLAALPSEFSSLCGPNLRSLDLHNNQFSMIPSIIESSCPNLENLDLSQNNISSIPSSMPKKLPNLRRFIITDNRLTALPPSLGEMVNLEILSVEGNPLVSPKLESIQAVSGGASELKALLVSSNKLSNQAETHESSGNPTTPNIARTRSFTESRSKSSKASRRMGLIINNKATPENAGGTSGVYSYTPSKPERKLSQSMIDHAENAPISQQNDRVKMKESSSSPPDTAPTESPTALSTGLNRPANPPRNRSNTFKDIDNILGHSEATDSDHKSGAYFKRLSTLQERPGDEVQKHDKPITSISQDREDPYKTSEKLSTSPSRKLSKSNLSHQSTTTGQVLFQSHTPSNGPSTTSYDKGVLVKVARKILFAFSELHLAMKRFTGFCTDKKVSARVINLLYSSKEHIDHLVETMEAVEGKGEDQELIKSALNTCISSFKMILSIFSENFQAFVAKIDVCFLRMVLLALFGSINELQNAHTLLHPPSNIAKPPSLPKIQSSLSTLEPKAKLPQNVLTAAEESLSETSGVPSASETVASVEEIDERLYQSIEMATKNAQIVFGELTKAMSKSAIATANTKNSSTLNPAVASKFKELTNVCISSMDITKRLSAKLSTIRANHSPTLKRSFWDDINLFLKAIIQTFSAVKEIMRDVPILNEVRSSMAQLTKTTKELTILLEASSYKTMSEATDSPIPASLPHSALSLSSSSASIPTTSALQTPGSVFALRNPLVASFGNVAAQALMGSQDSHGSQGQTPNSHNLPNLHLPPSVASDVSNTGLHTAPVQTMEAFYEKNVNPFDRI